MCSPALAAREPCTLTVVGFDARQLSRQTRHASDSEVPRLAPPHHGPTLLPGGGYRFRASPLSLIGIPRSQGAF
jgi:hypothetical protein